MVAPVEVVALQGKRGLGAGVGGKRDGMGKGREVFLGGRRGGKGGGVGGSNGVGRELLQCLADALPRPARESWVGT